MRKSIVAALMAATALIPAAASAQRGERNGDFNQRGQARQAAQQARLQQDVPVQQRAERQPVASPQARGDFDNDRRGNGGMRGREGQVPRPLQQAAPQDRRGANPYRGDRTEVRGAGAFANGGGGARRTDRTQFRDGSTVSVTRAGNRNDRGNGWNDNDRRRNDRNGWNGGWNDNDRRGNDRNGWNRNWRQDNRYDWNQRRQYNRNAYHLPRYYAPSGWNYGYRRFNVGFTLSTILFNQSYWIDDADYYGLPDAYGPYRWVRYYNDALLVDLDSGAVVDTVYDIFW